MKTTYEIFISYLLKIENPYPIVKWY